MKKIRNILAIAMALVLLVGLVPMKDNTLVAKTKEIQKVVIETNFRDVYGIGKEIKPVDVKVLEGEVDVKFECWTGEGKVLKPPYHGEVFNAGGEYRFSIELTPKAGYDFPKGEMFSSNTSKWADFVYDGIQTGLKEMFGNKSIHYTFYAEDYVKDLGLDKPVEKTEEKPAEKVELAPLAANEARAIITIGSNALDKVKISGQSQVTMDAAAYIKDGRTMLPLRFVAEALGLSVDWVEETRTAIVQDSQYRVEIPVDTNKIIVNGIETTSDVKPEIVNGRTMLPVANIARALGLEDGKGIVWDAATKQVTLTRAINQ